MQLDKQYHNEFQNSLNFEKIDLIWKNFRQAGNSIEGKILKMNFKKIMNRLNIKNEKFVDKLFERFKLDKYQQSKLQKQQIDLQDLVIGLAILVHISFIDKVKYIFYLTDLDQDGCLSLQEIENMIERIEKIFCKQNASARVESYSLLFDNAHRKAQRNYKEIIVLLKRNNNSLRDDDSSLITCDEFLQALKSSMDLYQQQKFIPLNLSLNDTIVQNFYSQNNVVSQPLIRIHQDNKSQFCEFRKQIYQIFQKKSDKDNTNIIRYPGKVQIVKNKGIMSQRGPIVEHIVQVLPNFQKNQEKKILKASTKNKNNLKNAQQKEFYDHKRAEQNLQAYKMKVKKMIQTKLDPRLNIHFDKMVRK